MLTSLTCERDAPTGIVSFANVELLTRRHVHVSDKIIVLWKVVTGILAFKLQAIRTRRARTPERSVESLPLSTPASGERREHVHVMTMTEHSLILSGPTA
jgi:hypothetical protein